MDMFPGEICPERERLLRIANATIYAHSKMVSAIIRDIADPKHKWNAEELAAVRDDIRDSLLAAQATWVGYENHIKEHGCKRTYVYVEGRRS